MTIDEFIKQHKHVYYCEAIIDNNEIEYAIPSHQQYLLKHIQEKYNITSKQLSDEMPIYADCNEWLCDKFDMICIWYDFGIAGHNADYSGIEKLIKSGIVSNDFTLKITDEYLRCKKDFNPFTTDYRKIINF